MKKFIFLTTALLAFSTASIFAQIGVPSVKNVKGPDKDKVEVYSITFTYPAEDIAAAIKERLENEGLSGKKEKNNFVSYKGIRYNYLWNKTFDFYISITGSKTAGTIDLLVSQGYDNYVDVKNDDMGKRASKWLLSLEQTIKEYRYNVALTKETEGKVETTKTLAKLEKEQKKYENILRKNEEKQKAFDAKKTIVTGGNVPTINNETFQKEKKELEKIQEEKNKYQYKLKEVKRKISMTQTDLKNREKSIDELKQAKP